VKMHIALLLTLAAVMFTAGCSQNASNQEDDARLAAVQKKAGENPVVWKLLGTIVDLAKDGIQELAKYGEKLKHRQDLQASARRWLIGTAIASGLFALLAGAGKLLSASPTWYGMALGWLGEQVRLRSIIVAALICAACICGAIWIAPLWRYAVAALWVAAYALTFFGGWELSCRRYTGAWKADGLVRLPKGWQAAKE